MFVITKLSHFGKVSAPAVVGAPVEVAKLVRNLNQWLDCKHLRRDANVRRLNDNLEKRGRSRRYSGLLWQLPSLCEGKWGGGFALTLAPAHDTGAIERATLPWSLNDFSDSLRDAQVTACEKKSMALVRQVASRKIYSDSSTLTR